MKQYSIGIDYGTNSVRALVVDTSNGREVGEKVYDYPSGTDGILLDSGDHNLARQSPVDYLAGLQKSVTGALRAAARRAGVKSEQVVGIGVDTTGSTPVPVDQNNVPMCASREFRKNLNAQAWLWKDHTAIEEAAEITTRASKLRPEYLKKCGGVYSSEWFWAKMLHCVRVDPRLFEKTCAWIELEDYIPAILCGVKKPEDIVRGVCAAGHKALYNETWGGWPDDRFLAGLDKRLVDLKKRMPAGAFSIDTPAGRLSEEWARKLGLSQGIPVAVGAFDAHLGGVGAGIKPGTLVKIVGTSTCDIMVVRNTSAVPDIPGVCGMVDGSVLPGHVCIEAGQSAVGDIFRWFSNILCEGDDRTQVDLTKKAGKLKPGQTGLLSLDWNNGNRTILVDPKLTGLIVGMTLHTRREEIYRALLEATAFGALTIINRIEEYDVKIKQVVCCGGISEKNQLFMQIYADVLNRPMYISRSAQTCALGAAIAGSVVGGAHRTVGSAIKNMTGVKSRIFKPNRRNVAVYRDLYTLYSRLHDAFGVSDSVGVARVMKDLLAIKARVD